MVPSPGPYLLETHTRVMGVKRGFETCGHPRGYTGQPSAEGQALLSRTLWTLGETAGQAFSGALGCSGEAMSWPKAASRLNEACSGPGALGLCLPSPVPPDQGRNHVVLTAFPGEAG